MSVKGEIVDLLKTIKGDEDLIESLSEIYAGDDETYADRLAVANSLDDAYEIMTSAAYIARVSGDYLNASNILDAYATYRG